MDWSEPEFDELGSELRRNVGGEFRLEAEAVEGDAAKLTMRRRTLTDIAVELMNRGDEVGAVGAGVSFSGVITYAADDLAILESPHFLANINLAGPVSLQVLRRAHEGGRGRTNGSPSYRSRMLELEISGEFVEVISSSSTLTGRIRVVGADHLVLEDRDRTEWYIPLAAIAFTLQR